MIESMHKPMKYPQEDLAHRLRSAMNDAKLSQADLARACGVTIQAVHGWREHGRIGKQHLWTICKLTGKSLEYFLLGLTKIVGAVVLATSLASHEPASFDNKKVAMSDCLNTDCMPKLRAIWRNVVLLFKLTISLSDTDASLGPA